jgi:hypothetical protein
MGCDTSSTEPSMQRSNSRPACLTNSTSAGSAVGPGVGALDAASSPTGIRRRNAASSSRTSPLARRITSSASRDRLGCRSNTRDANAACTLMMAIECATLS